MGKTLPTQRRGRGTSPTYRSPSHRHIGLVDLPRKKGEGTVVEIRHAPGRSAPVARIELGDDEFLMIAPDGLAEGQRVAIGVPRIDRGTVLPLGQLPEGTLVYNVEIVPGDGGRLGRGAGPSAGLVGQGARRAVPRPA